MGDGELNVDLGEFQTNLVPFPRLHFMTTALAPVVSLSKKDHEAGTVREITDHVFQPQNMLADKNVCMIGNNVAVSRVFTERINKKYDMMYSQRAFVHWYV